jgi:hypothetical protein
MYCAGHSLQTGRSSFDQSVRQQRGQFVDSRCQIEVRQAHFDVQERSQLRVQNKNYADPQRVYLQRVLLLQVDWDGWLFLSPFANSLFNCYTTSLITVTITVTYLTARLLTLGRPLRPHYDQHWSLCPHHPWVYYQNDGIIRSSTVPLQSCNASSTHRDELLRFQPNEYIWNQSANACTRTYKVAR